MCLASLVRWVGGQVGNCSQIVSFGAYQALFVQPRVSRDRLHGSVNTQIRHSVEPPSTEGACYVLARIYVGYIQLETITGIAFGTCLRGEVAAHPLQPLNPFSPRIFATTTGRDAQAVMLRNKFRASGRESRQNRETTQLRNPLLFPFFPFSYPSRDNYGETQRPKYSPCKGKTMPVCFQISVTYLTLQE